MRKRSNEIIISITIICFVFFIGYFLVHHSLSQEILNKKEEENQIEKNSVEKTETEDYYLYNVYNSESNFSYSWKIKKEKTSPLVLEDSLNIVADLKIKLNEKNQNTDAINRKVNQKKILISLERHGSSPIETTIHMDVKKIFKEKKKLYLYYYNVKENQIEFVKNNIEVKDGQIEVGIDENYSEYFLTEKMVRDAVGNPEKTNYIMILLVIIIFFFLAVTLKEGKRN